MAIGQLMQNVTADQGDKPEAPQKHQITRARMEIRRRRLTVTAISRITPDMLRVVLTSPDLADFDSRGPDDHIKLFFPSADGEEPQMRDYTPRAFDRDACTLTIDFALHGMGAGESADPGHQAGPATAWALNAKVGDHLDIGGPRGSMIVADDFDWYLLIADETGLPAIGRRLEELRAGVRVITAVTVASRADIQTIETATDWHAHWLVRSEISGDPDQALADLVAGLELPPGDGFVFIAAEAALAKSIRRHVIEDRGLPPGWMRASGYWRRGTVGVHENLD